MVCQARIPFLVLCCTLLKSSLSCSLACSHERCGSHASAFCTGVGVLIEPSDFLALTTAPENLPDNSSSIDARELRRPMLYLAPSAPGKWCLQSHEGRERVSVLVQNSMPACKFVVVDVRLSAGLGTESRAWRLPQFFKGQTGLECTTH